MSFVKREACFADSARRALFKEGFFVLAIHE